MCRQRVCDRRDGEVRIDSTKYVEEVRALIKGSMDTIARADEARREVLDRTGLPQALGVSWQAGSPGFDAGLTI